MEPRRSREQQLGDHRRRGSESDPQQAERTHANRLNQLGVRLQRQLNTEQNGKTIRYDAWNRVVEQKNGAISEVVYRYDGTGRRIREGNRTIFYSNNWQAVEERLTATNAVATNYVWSLVYVDAMILREVDTNADGVLDQRLFGIYDVNYNITTLVAVNFQGGANPVVVQRFQYDSYGKRTVLTPAWAATSDAYNFLQGFAGGKQDPTTGRIHFRNRDYDPNLMRWISRDPIGFKGSEWSLYEYVESNPLRYTDPTGMVWWWPFGGGGGKTCPAPKLGIFDRKCLDFCQEKYGDEPFKIASCVGICTAMKGKGCTPLGDFCLELGSGGQKKGAEMCLSIFNGICSGKFLT